MIVTKNVEMEISNCILRLRVSKINQWEALLVDITEHPIMPAQTFNILEITVGASTHETGGGGGVDLTCSSGTLYP